MIPSGAHGADGLRGRVIPSRAPETDGLRSISPVVLTTLFQLNEHFVPKTWKLCHIITATRVQRQTELSDFRPGALTSVLWKCFQTRCADQCPV